MFSHRTPSFGRSCFSLSGTLSVFKAAGDDRRIDSCDFPAAI